MHPCTDPEASNLDIQPSSNFQNQHGDGSQPSVGSNNQSALNEHLGPAGCGLDRTFADAAGDHGNSWEDHGTGPSQMLPWEDHGDRTFADAAMG